FTIFLSIAHLSAVTFPDKVHDYVGGTKEDFQIYELNKKKSLVYEPKNKSIDRNFIVFLQDAKYHYNLKYSDELSNKDIVIKAAKKCSLFSLIKETASYKLFECHKSIFFVNKRKSKVKVNEEVVEEKKFLSKGPPIFLNGELIYYRGRAI
ncbi:MAG: hypothetical protein WEB87_05110, partial [Bacteriovoracaceae bacterium]